MIISNRWIENWIRNIKETRWNQLENIIKSKLFFLLANNIFFNVSVSCLLMKYFVNGIHLEGILANKKKLLKLTTTKNYLIINGKTKKIVTKIQCIKFCSTFNVVVGFSFKSSVSKRFCGVCVNSNLSSIAYRHHHLEAVQRWQCVTFAIFFVTSFEPLQSKYTAFNT